MAKNFNLNSETNEVYKTFLNTFKSLNKWMDEYHEFINSEDF